MFVPLQVTWDDLIVVLTWLQNLGFLVSLALWPLTSLQKIYGQWNFSRYDCITFQQEDLRRIQRWGPLGKMTI